MLLSYYILSGALESFDLLQSYSMITVALHNTIILIITPKSFNFQLHRYLVHYSQATVMTLKLLIKEKEPLLFFLYHLQLLLLVLMLMLILVMFPTRKRKVRVKVKVKITIRVKVVQVLIIMVWTRLTWVVNLFYLPYLMLLIMR